MGQSVQTEIKVTGDPRINMQLEDYNKKTIALLTLRNLLSETHELIDFVSSVKTQLIDLKTKLYSNGMDEDKELNSLIDKITAFKDEHLMRPPPSMNYRQKPRLREEIRSLMRAIDNTTNPPTLPQLDRIKSLNTELREHQKTMKTMEVSIQGVNDSNSNLPSILLKNR
jgi:hypothetical protein